MSRHAKSVQVSLTPSPKGVSCRATSVSLSRMAPVLTELRGCLAGRRNRTAMEVDVEVDKAPMARAAQVDTPQTRATDAPPKAAKRSLA